jgi:hypothetical protein
MKNSADERESDFEKTKKSLASNAELSKDKIEEVDFLVQGRGVPFLNMNAPPQFSKQSPYIGSNVKPKQKLKQSRQEFGVLPTGQKEVGDRDGDHPK